ncbi:MAG: hypothetical protein JSV49_12345 [Thermoplasmata archaeon]|nr:MAG: hypothetical protein JSV49_12345 [Thermoplasmata archaeon]
MIKIPRKKSSGKKKGGARKGRGKKTAGKKAGAEPNEAELPIDISSLTGECILSDVIKMSWDEYRDMPQDVINNVLNPETITHLIRAALEAYAVMRELKPGEPLPESTMLRIHRTERELLLAVKAAMDMRLKDLEIKIESEEKQCKPLEKSPAEKLLKEIKVKD